MIICINNYYSRVQPSSNNGGGGGDGDGVTGGGGVGGESNDATLVARTNLLAESPVNSIEGTDYDNLPSVAVGKQHTLLRAKDPEVASNYRDIVNDVPNIPLVIPTTSSIEKFVPGNNEDNTPASRNTVDTFISDNCEPSEMNCSNIETIETIKGNTVDTFFSDNCERSEFSSEQIPVIPVVVSSEVFVSEPKENTDDTSSPSVWNLSEKPVTLQGRLEHMFQTHMREKCSGYDEEEEEEEGRGGCSGNDTTTTDQLQQQWLPSSDEAQFSGLDLAETTLKRPQQRRIPSLNQEEATSTGLDFQSLLARQAVSALSRLGIMGEESSFGGLGECQETFSDSDQNGEQADSDSDDSESWLQTEL